MPVTRRFALKAAAAAGTAAVASVVPSKAEARDRKVAPEDAVGMLYDTTLCIGCKTCVVACQDANDLPPDDRGYGDGLYDSPPDLNDRAKNIIKLFDDGRRRSYVKRQCMHCIDPACVGACMIGALQKREFGIVTWDANACIGCRYCQMACPFNIPKFEWDSRAPRIIKCELCNHLLAQGQEPACCAVCPRQAVIYGKYEDLLEEARRRLAENPGKYVPKIYGEADGGGTQVLYLSHVPFEDLGFPELSDEGVPHTQQSVQHGIYQGFIAPVALYGVLGAVMWRNRRKGEDAGEEVSE